MRRFIAALLAALLTLSAACTAEAQLLLTGVGGAGGAASAFSVNFKQSYNSGTISTTSLSATGLSVGTAGAHRLVVFFVSALSATNHTASLPTIAGTPMNAVVTDPTQTRSLEVYELVVTTGTTVTIDMTWDVNVTRVSGDVYVVNNANGDAFSNRSGSVPSTVGGATLNIASLTLADPTNGIAIASARSSLGTANFSWSQSAGAGGTTDSNFSNGSSLQMSSYRDTPGTSPVQYTAAQVGGTLIRGAAVAFKP